MVDNQIFAIAGAKGGVGKTTTGINLGAVLADAGYSTAVVELDLGMANLVDFIDVDIDAGSDTTLHDVLADEATVDEAAYRTPTGLTIVPSGTTLDGYAETELTHLPEITDHLRRHYDIVLFDTPAGLSRETVRPIQLADEVLLISTPRVSAIRNVKNTMELADRVGADHRGLILTKSGTGASPGADKIAEFLELELLGHVPEDDAIPHSQDRGKPVVEYAPNSGAAIAYRKIADKLTPENATIGDTTASPSETTSPSEGTDASEAERGGSDEATRTVPTAESEPAKQDSEPATPQPGAGDGNGREADAGDRSTPPADAAGQEPSERSQSEPDRTGSDTPTEAGTGEPEPEPEPAIEPRAADETVGSGTGGTGSTTSGGREEDSGVGADPRTDPNSNEGETGGESSPSAGSGEPEAPEESTAAETSGEATASETSGESKSAGESKPTGESGETDGADSKSLGQKVRSFFIG